MNVKYGIRVPFNGVELWVQEDSGNPFPDNLKVMLFDNRDDAEEIAKMYDNYSIEEYYDIEKFDWEQLAYRQKG